MDTEVLISSFEALYVIYMFNYFKTTFEMHHPLEAVITGAYNFLQHPFHNGIYENKLCQLGNCAGFVLAFLIMYRAYYLITGGDQNMSRQISILFLGFVVFFALLTNMNAFLYLIPVILIENMFFL